MIKIEDVRLGNVFNRIGESWDKNVIGKPVSLGVHFMIDLYQYPAFKATLEPIPLTPEWLERCGFEKLGNIFGYHLRIPTHVLTFKSISVVFNNDTSEIQYYLFMREGEISQERDKDSIVTITKSLKYLHELQNVFYCITNTELNINL